MSSRMPQETEIPAPVKTIIFLLRLIKSTTSSGVLICSSLARRRKLRYTELG